MPSAAQPAPRSKGRLWAGRIMSAIPAVMLLFAGTMKLIKPPSMVQGLAQYRYPENLVGIIGVVEIACTVLYLIPRTSVLGAILVTGFLGGATATNVGVKDPSFIFPVVFGVLFWAGLFLRDEGLRALIPRRS
jgi:DoxX-like protein